MQHGDAPRKFVDRKTAALMLSAVGLQTSPATLATLASRGGGPPYRRYGRRVVYVWSDLLAWANARVSTVRCNTSQSSVAFEDEPPTVSVGSRRGLHETDS